MNPNSSPNERFALCLSDILSLFQRSKKSILLWGCVLGILGFFLGLMKPLTYEATGTLKEARGKDSSFSGQSHLAQILIGNSLQGSTLDIEAASLIKSRKLLKEVIKKHGFQATLEDHSDVEGITTRIKNNLVAAKAILTGAPKPILSDVCCPLKIISLDYPGEAFYSFLVRVDSEDHFEIMEMANPSKKIAQGKLGEPFQFDTLSLTFQRTKAEPFPSKKTFNLMVRPLPFVVDILSTHLKIEPTKEDKSLLKISFEHRDRHLSSSVINSIMEAFQNYLKGHHQEITLKQLDYLNQRRDLLSTNLANLMRKHADYLNNDVNSSGFINCKKEMLFLAENQQEQKKKLLANEIEIKRLESIVPGNLAYYDRHSPLEGDSSVINHILSEIRGLKQQRDMLEIDLQKKSIKDLDTHQNTLEQQLAELNGVQNYIIELRQLIALYLEGRSPDPQSKLLNDPRFLLKDWFNRIETLRINDSSDSKKIEENFQFYLSNLERLFGVHEHVLQERLTHQQNPSGDYQGINLEVVTELYLGYVRQVIQAESSIRQNLFFIHQLENPDFEITSLSSVLIDPVSSEMINRASELVLNSRDLNNQTSREQERIKDELNLQRTFLAMHLEQMVQVIELNKELLEEKIFALQNVGLELIHQQISLLEKNLHNYIQSKLTNLAQERLLIKDQLQNIRNELSLLPEKWVSEQLIDQEVESNKLIVQEIVKMVESKNIAHNIEVIQSAPLDSAIPSIHPKFPKAFSWGFYGFIFGLIIGSMLTVIRTFRKGLMVSADNLRQMGFHVSGTLSDPLYSNNGQLKEENLATLRRLQAYFDPFFTREENNPDADKVLILIEGGGPHYAPALSNLFKQRGLKTLSLDTDFSHSKKDNSPGLLQYLKGELEFLPIQETTNGDYVPAGGITQFGTELIASPLFQKLITDLKNRYEKILIVSKTAATSPEAETLMISFPFITVTLMNEKTEDLKYFEQFLENHSFRKLTFILGNKAD